VKKDWPARWLRDKLDYVAGDIGLFEAALTHRSASGRNSERLEFLGDAVLNLLVAEQLYRRFGDASEGDLSRLRARLVSAEPLAAIAQDVALGDELQLGSGELKTGGFRRQSILSDALEAVIGAVYLDRGLEPARVLVEKLFRERVAGLPGVSELKDPKTRLQEWLQARGAPLPVYVVENVEGEAHVQHFRVRCEASGLGLQACGEGSSRRRAEQDAAQRLIDALPVAGKP
jgi:ribonuclease-3